MSRPRLRIAIVSTFYSEGMGYTENCLPRALAALGHDVHVIASTYNVYGNERLYDRTYREFLGPPEVGTGTLDVDGYRVYRLDSTMLAGYVRIRGLLRKIKELVPDIVHSLEIASLQTFELAIRRPLAQYRLFTETHQSMSVVRPYLKEQNGHALRKTVFRTTRTVPAFLASLAVEACYAVTPDCAEVAQRFYGIPRAKLKLQSLGTDTDLFHPVTSDHDRVERAQLRRQFGFAEEDVVCIYTGRFSEEKNPLLLAKAIEVLGQRGARFKGLFVGNGVQATEIDRFARVSVLPFMTHRDLARHYRAADIAVWPQQESISHLDAAATGLPVVLSNRIGEPARVVGNGKMYAEGSLDSLVDVLRELASAHQRQALGAAGRRKMVEGFSWKRCAESLETDFLAALGGAKLAV